MRSEKEKEQLFLNNGQPAVNIKEERVPFFGIHLQWFSDSDDEDAPGKTHEPTEFKLRRLREEEGQVAKSRELIGAIGLIMPAVLLIFLAPSILNTCAEMIKFFFSRAVELDVTKDPMVAGFFLRYFIQLVWPILLVGVIAALFSNIVQVGFKFTVKPITPDFSRIVPRLGKFFKRIFSVDGAYSFFMSIAKLLIIGGVVFSLIYSDLDKLLNLQKASVWTGLVTVSEIAYKMLIITAILLLVLSIPDYMFQKARFRKRHMMTRKELKDEFKQQEADPEIRQRIRRRFQDMLKQNYAATVPKADVIITNPTHIAIAVQFDERTMEGPMVVAVGADEMSARIREIASVNEVPLVENKPLAWALYRETNVGDIIPKKYWDTVAVVLSKVWHLNEERRRRLSA